MPHSLLIQVVIAIKLFAVKVDQLVQTEIVLVMESPLIMRVNHQMEVIVLNQLHNAAKLVVEITMYVKPLVLNVREHRRGNINV